MTIERIAFTAAGQVQGVGFRPFVFTLAEETGLTGFVRNGPDGVHMEVQGRPDAVERFAEALATRLPPLARITSLTRRPLPVKPEETGFAITASAAGAAHNVLISPDTATCPDCLAETLDPANRRYRYAFTNCTHCGPRYTITRSIPYDRPFTSMACFPLCPACRAEYENPRDRRFHAQPNACPVCGPEVWFVRAGGAGSAFPFHEPATPGAAPPPTGDAALAALAEFLLAGNLAAVKGLGGFHLACDARREDAVAALRRRKHRPHKPFAVMAADADTARRIARIGPAEERLLLSPERPIVLCPLRPHGPLAPGIAPDNRTVGIMLPYTPLHHGLFKHIAGLHRARTRPGDDPPPAVLVMTSGNPGGEPICLGNREALEHLAAMADGFLFHNRDILIRVDDSVVRPLPDGGTLFYRRARGYVPRPVDMGPAGKEDEAEGPRPPAPFRQKIEFPAPSTGGTPAREAAVLPAPDEADGERGDPLPPSGKREGEAFPQSAPAASPPFCVLGVGAELKNTLCLTKGRRAFVSQHIGDMSNLETAAFHEEIREHLTDVLRVEPALIVRDKHPDYLSSRAAEELAEARGLPALALQHHFAHAHAVLAENGFRGRALVWALDGTGLGDDGTLWGGELLLVDTGTRGGAGPEHKRVAHLAPLPLPGGEAAIREPWRIAHGLLLRLGLADGNGKSPDGPEIPLPWMPEQAATAAMLPLMLHKGINTPLSTSCGRLFDAASALLGLCNTTSYEGQAAIRLEQAQEADADAPPLPPEPGAALYPCPVLPETAGAPLVLDTHALLAALHADRQRGAAVADAARRFHVSLCAALAELAAHAAQREGVRHVAFSGGCLQNVTLAVTLPALVRRHGLTPLTHKELPPGDGCISFGQAAWGRLRLGG